jgi:hypothetical protein
VTVTTQSRVPSRVPIRVQSQPPGGAQWFAESLFWGLLAVVALSYVMFRWLPYQDLPAHTGLLAVRQRLDTSAFLGQHFERGSLLGPYGLFLWLGHALGSLLGPERGLRVVAAAANVAVPLALLAARRRLGGPGEPWWGAGLLALVLALGFPTALGLTSFLLGQAVLLLAAAHWVRALDARAPGRGPGEAGARETDARERRRDLIAVGLYGLLAAFTHGFALALLVLFALVSAAVTPARVRRLAPAALALAPGIAALVLVAWRDRGFYPPPAAGRELFGYAGLTDKLVLPLLPTLFSRLGVDLVASLALWIVVGVGLAHGARPAAAAAGGDIGAGDGAGACPGVNAEERDPVAARRRVLARAALVIIALGLVAPTRVAWFGSVDLRLVSTGLLLAVAGLAPPAHRPATGSARWLAAAPPVLAAAMVATLLVALALFQPEARARSAALAGVPAGAILPAPAADPTSRVWAARAFLHWDKRLLIDRDVVVSNLWQHQGTALRLRRAPAAGAGAPRTPPPRSGL